MSCMSCSAWCIPILTAYKYKYAPAICEYLPVFKKIESVTELEGIHVNESFHEKYIKIA